MQKFSIFVCLILIFGCRSVQKFHSASQKMVEVSLQDESRPIQYVFVSEPTENDGTPPAEDKFSVTKKIVKAVLPALSVDQKLYFVGSKEKFSRLVPISESKKTALDHIIAKPYMWLQDLIEFGETNVGLTAFVSYGNLSMKETATRIVQSVGKVGPDLKILNSKAVHGTIGGNIEKWPGEIGVIGTSDFETKDAMTEFARQIFPGEKLLFLPTSWLTIGHVDEVIKLIRYQPGDRCELEFLINNPDIALKILRKQKEKLFLEELEFGTTRISEIKSIQELCKRGGLNCTRPRNGQIARILERGSLRKNITVVRESLRDLKSAVVSIYREHRPSCLIKWIEAPSIHLVSMNKKGPVPHSGQSVLPSLTNGLLVNETYIVADPGNSVFRKTFSDSMAKAGISVQYIPFGKEVFRGEPFDGHVHCMTQVLRR